MTNKYIKYEIYIAKTYTKYAFFATAQLKLKPSENGLCVRVLPRHTSVDDHRELIGMQTQDMHISIFTLGDYKKLKN